MNYKIYKIITFVDQIVVPEEWWENFRMSRDSLYMLYKGRYRFFIVLAFSCRRAKSIGIRYVWTRIFLKTEKKMFVFKNIRIRVDWARIANF